MPRKTATRPRDTGALKSFNEAAARCRGKHRELVQDQEHDPASMRPRPDAAENFNNLGELIREYPVLQ